MTTIGMADMADLEEDVGINNQSLHNPFSSNESKINYKTPTHFKWVGVLVFCCLITGRFDTARHERLSHCLKGLEC